MTDVKSIIIQQTELWINSFIIKLNLCPFAKREMAKGRVNMQTSEAATVNLAQDDLMVEIERLNSFPAIETTFLIFPLMLNDFFDYLDFVLLAESSLADNGYEGIYQLATFHPNYCFANTSVDDVTNYTNRSPYPMLHILREDSVEKAIAFYGDTEKIPEANMSCLRKLGIEKVKKLVNRTS